MLRRTVVAVVAVVLACGWAGAAWGEPGGKADPTDDVFDAQSQRTGEGHLDVVKVSHDDDGRTVRYTIRTAHQWASDDLGALHVYLDRLEGVPQYDCVQIAAVVERKDGKLAGHLSQCLGSGGGAEGGPGGSRNIGPVTVEHAEMTDSITVSFALEPLRRAGFSGSSYRYNIWMKEASTQASDTVPNASGWITHTFSAPATPVPTAVPTPEATATPTPEPTLAPTPEPTADPTPRATTTPDVISFAAPRESSGDGGTSTPLRVAAAASVLAGAGMALVQFRPF